MTGARVLITSISAATGTCFAVLAGLSISVVAVPVRRFHIFSVVIAGVASCLAYLAFRTAIGGKVDEETVVKSLRRGIVGAFVGLMVAIVFLFLFGPQTHGFLAHSVGKPASSLTNFRLMLASLLLGFGAGFVVRMPMSLA